MNVVETAPTNEMYVRIHMQQMLVVRFEMRLPQPKSAGTRVAPGSRFNAIPSLSKGELVILMIQILVFLQVLADETQQSVA